MRGCTSDLPVVATGISAILVIEAFATPTLAGVEHVAAVVVGLIFGWWWHRSQRHGSPTEVVEPAGPVVTRFGAVSPRSLLSPV